MDVSLDFTDLRGTWHWVNALAYWIAVCRRPTEEAGGWLDVCDAMSGHFDVENQVSCDGWPEAGKGDTWYRQLRLFAPVQLVKEWSPFPLAEQLLGVPLIREVDVAKDFCRSVVFTWGRGQLGGADLQLIEPDCADHQRFVSLLRVGVERARQRGEGLLLAGRPGWGADSGLAMPGWVAKSMKK
jgi:hypothetical protein